jgi:3-deoxy-D-manno-octulosonic-acid transferase
VQTVGAAGLPVRLRSENASQTHAVIVLDSVGELSQIYAAADVAFVGGSLIARGGHNVLEPVLCGVPVAFGPHIDNFRDAALLVERADAGQKVDDEAQLAAVWNRWLNDADWRKAVAQRAENVLREHRGASLRVAKTVAQSLRKSDIEYSNEGLMNAEMSKEATL